METLKVIIAGSRTINNYNVLLNKMNEIANLYPNYTFEIISGGAKGIDTNARDFAIKNNLIYYEYKPIYESQYDPKAPLRRNKDMAKVGDILVAIWDEKSTGTGHMITCMENLGKPVYKHIVK